MNIYKKDGMEFRQIQLPLSRRWRTNKKYIDTKQTTKKEWQVDEWVCFAFGFGGIRSGGLVTEFVWFVLFMFGGKLCDNRVVRFFHTVLHVRLLPTHNKESVSFCFCLHYHHKVLRTTAKYITKSCGLYRGESEISGEERGPVG